MPFGQFARGPLCCQHKRLRAEQPITSRWRRLYSDSERVGRAAGRRLGWAYSAFLESHWRAISNAGDAGSSDDRAAAGWLSWVTRRQPAGWCSGNAGHVFLLTAAHDIWGETLHLDLARRAAWGVWEQGAHFNNVCCGAAGCAYAMLNLFRHTGDREWRARADRSAIVWRRTRMRRLVSPASLTVCTRATSA